MPKTAKVEASGMGRASHSTGGAAMTAIPTSRHRHYYVLAPSGFRLITAVQPACTSALYGEMNRQGPPATLTLADSRQKSDIAAVAPAVPMIHGCKSPRSQRAKLEQPSVGFHLQDQRPTEERAR